MIYLVCILFVLLVAAIAIIPNLVIKEISNEYERRTTSAADVLALMELVEANAKERGVLTIKYHYIIEDDKND